MKLGILTGGGDCPGLNPAIRGVVRGSINYGHTFVGIQNGWKGLLTKNTIPLGLDDVAEILYIGGTILGTSRTNPYKEESDRQLLLKNIKELGLDCVVAIGGEDTLGVAAKLSADGVNVIGLPKTIDNDLLGTDYTFGFDTAVSIICDALDRIRTTAKSHNRTMVVEVMGRHAGWLAAAGGIAGGADMILIPEKKFEISKIADCITTQKARGKNYSIVVVAEGASPKDKNITKDAVLDAFGHNTLGGIGQYVCDELTKALPDLDCRVTVLGHIQRGGSPTANDRILATRYGIAAAELIDKGDFGKMVCLHGNKISSVSLAEISTGIKTVDDEYFSIAEHFFA